MNLLRGMVLLVVVVATCLPTARCWWLWGGEEDQPGEEGGGSQEATVDLGELAKQVFDGKNPLDMLNENSDIKSIMDNVNTFLKDNPEFIGDSLGKLFPPEKEQQEKNTKDEKEKTEQIKKDKLVKDEKTKIKKDKKVEKEIVEKEFKKDNNAGDAVAVKTAKKDSELVQNSDSTEMNAKSKSEAQSEDSPSTVRELPIPGGEIGHDHGPDVDHYTGEGHHNPEYDHQVFLGDEASEFSRLTPEESQQRLAVILNKIDTDNDNIISVPELTAWIRETEVRSVRSRTEQFWERSNPDNREQLGWDEFRARQYGFLTDMHIADTEGRFVGEDDVDSDTLKVYKDLEQRDRRRWTVADRNKDLQLSKEEFLGFVHPEVEPHMSDILVLETMADLDKDHDGKLNLTEYILNMFGDTKDPKDWESGSLQFRQFRDKNLDGFIDKHELKAWLLPADYDQHAAEAQHLLHESDRNGDRKVSKEEALASYSIFVSSQATNFGEDLRNHDEL